VKARKHVLHNKNNDRHFGDNFFCLLVYITFLFYNTNISALLCGIWKSAPNAI
jgi:hypothetical protein